MATTIVVTAIEVMKAIVTQKRKGCVNRPGLKFMPMIPASSAPGRKITDASVDLVRLAVGSVIWRRGREVDVRAAVAETDSSTWVEESLDAFVVEAELDRYLTHVLRR